MLGLCRIGSGRSGMVLYLTVPWHWGSGNPGNGSAPLVFTRAFSTACLLQNKHKQACELANGSAQFFILEKGLAPEPRKPAKEAGLDTATTRK